MTKPHRHCAVCGTPIPLEERTCSTKCQNILTENQKKVNKTKKIIYAVFAAFVLIWIFLVISGRM